MAKVPIALRLLPETLERVDAYAKQRKASRQVVLEAAVEGFLVEVQGGAPDLPAPKPAPKWVDPNPGRPRNLLAGRQARLNKEMGWDR